MGVGARGEGRQRAREPQQSPKGEDGEDPCEAWLLTYILSYCLVVGDGRSGESHRPSIPHGNSTSSTLCKEEEGDDEEERRKGVGGGRKQGRKEASE